jgi:hypothetical protein
LTLLNRWIVPLDRRVDYLSLNYGVRFQIRFEVMIVFATNLEPSELADDAFMRRIPNKILARSSTSNRRARLRAVRTTALLLEYKHCESETDDHVDALLACSLRNTEKHPTLSDRVE